jgi:hypothetical protein
MGSVGPDDGDDESEFGRAFIPKQATAPTENSIAEKIASSRRLSNALDVMENDTKLSYIVQDILPDSGLIYFGGLSGTGKTILAIQLVADIILGRPCMTWALGESATEDMKALMFSLEMNELELGERLRHMYPNLNDDEKKVFSERFITYSEPAPFKLWESTHQLEFIRTVQASGAQIQLIDSASVSFGEEMNNQAQVNKSLDFLRMVRAKYNWAQVIVAHTRKPPAGIASNPAEITLNELFGHSGVAQSASTIIIMVEDDAQRKDVIKRGLDQREVEKKVHIINCKARFSANGGAFVSHLTSKNGVDKGEPLMFRRNAIPIAMTDEAKRKADKVLAKTDLADLMDGIDFGSLDDDD